MNHSESEMCVLSSPVEEVRHDNEFEISLNDTLRSLGGTTPTKQTCDDRKKTSTLNQGQDYSTVFDRSYNAITVMGKAYEEMFLNWQLESEVNSGLNMKVQKLQAALDLQKKFTKQLLDEKSRLQEEMERTERRPRLRTKVDGLETQAKGLKKEIRELKVGIESRDHQLEETNKKLEFYRQEFGALENEISEKQHETFRPRAKAFRRTHSVTEDRKANKPILGSKLISRLADNIRY